MLFKDYSFEKRTIDSEVFKRNQQYYVVNERDSLFWCLYILKYGFEAYEAHLPNSFETEKEEKFKFIEIVRDQYSKTILKQNQIKNTKNEIENNLANEECINIKTFIAVAILHKFDFLFVQKKKIYLNGMISTFDAINPNIFVIHHDVSTKLCSIDIRVDIPTLKKMITTYFLWENIEKPLKSISYYSHDHLNKLAVKMGYKRNNGDIKKDPKNVLYDFIAQLII
jgi:hypothetical protein